MCLALAIHKEALNQSTEGRLAVGNVILNRSNHPKFPESVCDVVKQRTKNVCQFSWYCKTGLRGYPREDIQQLARDLLSGKKKDNTNGSLFFHATSFSGWPGLYKTKIIGDHVFYKYRR